MQETQHGAAPLRFLSGPQVAAGLSVLGAADALQQAFRSGSCGAAPRRSQLPLGDGTLLVMPATSQRASDAVRAGVKLVTVRAANAALGAPSVQAIYLAFGGETLAPVAVLDGAALTELRTAAVSALAARLLARPDAHRLVLFGAGAMARAHLAALAAVCPVQEVVVVSRTAARAATLVEHAHRLGLAARLGAPADVASADLVCTCTTSSTPVFDGALLAAGTHVTAVGAYQPGSRELDDTAVTGNVLVVEDRDTALAEAGELCIPLAAGLISAADITADLTELCQGTRGRRSAADITVFKSVGLAVEDLVVANALLSKGA